MIKNAWISRQMGYCIPFVKLGFCKENRKRFNTINYMHAKALEKLEKQRSGKASLTFRKSGSCRQWQREWSDLSTACSTDTGDSQNTWSHWKNVTSIFCSLAYCCRSEMALILFHLTVIVWWLSTVKPKLVSDLGKSRFQALQILERQNDKIILNYLLAKY